MIKIINQLCMLFIFSTYIHIVAAQQADLQNSMRGHASPYLKLHQNDPVAWQEWSREILAMAKQQNKLVFVSIGYFSCHWCHVMQRESFSDDIVARFMNSEYISVKVDRELNPALDAYLIEFVQRTRGQAGWPLNVVITPEGYPVVGITYLPKTQFLSLLKQMNQLWQQNHAMVSDTARQAAEQLRDEKQLKKVTLSKKISLNLSTRFLQQTMEYANDMQGGFGEQSKFPMVPQLQALLSLYERKPQDFIKSFLLLTLDQMATQGMRDHIGGGFYRYTVDPDWQTPHFEKMLYDNASLATLYFRAGKVLKRPDYFGVGRETLNFMIRELLTSEGGLVASLSAVDDNNVEGGYYLWGKAELEKALKASELEVISQLWKMEDKPRFEAGYLPFHANSPDEVAKLLAKPLNETMELIAKAQYKLFRLRKLRKIPVDTKQLAAWNALALSAFVVGAEHDKSGRFREVAQGIRDYIVNQLWDGKTLHRHKNGLGEEALEDYAFVANGLYDWYKLTGNKDDLVLASELINIAWNRFYTSSGWVLSDKLILPYDFGVAIIDDAPMPSPSSMLIELTMRMTKQEPDLTSSAKGMNAQKMEAKIKDALSVGHDLMNRSPFSFPSQIEAMQSYFNDHKGGRN